MIDPKIIRETPDILDRAMARRHQPPLAATLTKLDEAYRFTQTSLQNLQKERNDLSAKIGELKKSGGNADALMARMSQLKIETATMDDVANNDKEKYHNALALVPNIPADDVPDGKDEKDNKEIARWGDEYQRAPANPKQHFELGEATGEMDFNLGAKLSGARFTVLKKNLARLERALANFMLDVHTQQNGYTEISPPLMVNEHIMFGTGQLPKFADDQFVTRQNMWLIPTAEVPLTNFVNDEIVDEAQLPLRLTAKTPCFRAEAGAAGRDTRGMLRQHQFYKVELVSITTPDQSAAEHERMTTCAEGILQQLQLPYRKVLLCAGDMGFASRKTYDLEVWLPGQNTYREISSCSNCGDFQARRMKARYRPAGKKETEFLHTLNGSGVAVGRCLIAVMENYQRADGTIAIPQVLQPYMGGMTEM